MAEEQNLVETGFLRSIARRDGFALLCDRPALLKQINVDVGYWLCGAGLPEFIVGIKDVGFPRPYRIPKTCRYYVFLPLPT